MEANIEIKENEYDDVRFEYRKTFFGGTKTVKVPLGKKKSYNVHLTINPTEEERAIILKYKIDELAVETAPKFTPEQLEQMEIDQRAMHGRSSEIIDNIVSGAMADLRAMKEQTLLGQYFDNPYIKSFDVRQDAHTYMDKLEKEILPLIKTQIDYYRLEAVRRDKRTINL
ncbi:MAG: hypothetical protein WA441_06105 [Methyloceanibacter sp.]